MKAPEDNAEAIEDDFEHLHRCFVIS